MSVKRVSLFLLSLIPAIATADVVTVFLDGTDRAVGLPDRGKAGRDNWTALVEAKGGTVLTDDFNGKNIDIPVRQETSVGNFSVYYQQKGDYSPQAGNTSPDPHPTGIFVGTTTTGRTVIEETIDGLELRFDTKGPETVVLEMRFDPPIYAWAADVYSIDGLGVGEGYRADSIDHTSVHILAHTFDLSEILEVSNGGYNSFFGVVSERPFSVLRFSAEGDGDRFRLDNVAIGR